MVTVMVLVTISIWETDDSRKGCTDTSDLRHFRPKTFRHRCRRVGTGAEESAQVPKSRHHRKNLRHFGTKHMVPKCLWFEMSWVRSVLGPKCPCTTQSTICANSQDDSRRMILATGNDSHNSMDVSHKQAAMLCVFQIKI